ncbi:MAG TPA: AbrB/MazE/SpoVT family DNA-binding domain-containing protein [Thermomicrobiaceae bacterium]|nr:AbrB/MazE/SpoVT family DNA-binding domain-containing protein [Thermomicrobiaceae bacterium]
MTQPEFEGTVDECGRVSIPVASRRRLGLKPGDRVRFTVDNARVVLRRRGSSIEAGYGAVRPCQRPEDVRALRDGFEQRVADEAWAGAAEH